MLRGLLSCVTTSPRPNPIPKFRNNLSGTGLVLADSLHLALLCQLGGHQCRAMGLLRWENCAIRPACLVVVGYCSLPSQLSRIIRTTLANLVQPTRLNLGRNRGRGHRYCHFPIVYSVATTFSSARPTASHRASKAESVFDKLTRRLPHFGPFLQSVSFLMAICGISSACCHRPLCPALVLWLIL